jgi:ABC-type transport system involved in multi-copper enzyme maturation permease subunit
LAVSTPLDNRRGSTVYGQSYVEMNMRTIDLALKDLSQILRDKRSLLFLVAMPIAFTFFMGFAYRGGTGDQNVDHRIPLAVVDPQPEAVLSQMLYARLEASDALRPVAMSEAQAMDALHKGGVAGVLVIPAGFSEGGVGARKAIPQLSLIADPTSTQGQSLYQLLRVPVAQLMSAVEISHEVADIVGAQARIEPSAEQSAALDLAWGKWEANARQSLVRAEQVVARTPDDPYGGNPYNQSSPGILVMFAMFGLVTSAQILVEERKTRTLQRLMTTAMRPWQIVAGHMLAMFGIVLAQTVLLVVFGQLALGVEYVREPLAVLLVAVAMGLWVAALGLLIGVLAKVEEQVILFSLIAMFLFSALGGTWFPLEGAGAAFATLGRLTPSAWAMTGFQNILIRGLGLPSVWKPAAILVAYAAAFFVVAVWRFRKSETAA